MSTETIERPAGEQNGSVRCIKDRGVRMKALQIAGVFSGP